MIACAEMTEHIMAPEKVFFFFRLIVYHQAIVYKCQNFLKVGVDVVITDQCNQSTLYMKSRLPLFTATIFLSL